MTARRFVLVLIFGALAVIATAQVARDNAMVVALAALTALAALAAVAASIAARTDRPWMFDGSPAKKSHVHVSSRTRRTASYALAVALVPLAAALAGLLLGGPTSIGVALAVVLASIVVVPLARSPLQADRPDLTRLAMSWGQVHERMSVLSAHAAFEEGRFLQAHAATKGAERAYARAKRLEQTGSPRIALPKLVVEAEEDADADTVDRIRKAFLTFDLLATVTPSYRRASRTAAPGVLRIETSIRGLLEHFRSQAGTWPQEAALRFAQLLESLWMVRQHSGELLIEDQDAGLVVRIPIGPSRLLAAELLWHIDFGALAGKARPRWWSLAFDSTSGWVVRLPDGALMRAPMQSSSEFTAEGRHRMVAIGAAAGAATIHTLEPAQSHSGDATTVTIRGSGIVCTPQAPTVSFGGSLAGVLSCGQDGVRVLAPAHAPGSVSVTVTNLGSAPSNALAFTYLASSPASR